MLKSLLLLVVLLASLALSVLALPPHQHNLKVNHNKWALGKRASAEDTLQIHIGVKQQNTDELQKILHEVSYPSSPRYGQHLTFEEVNELVSPSSESLEAVLAWLSEHGIHDFELNSNGDMVRFTTSIGTAEKMLNAKYHHLHHSESGQSIIRAIEYSVPQEVAPHIDFVGPTTRLPLWPHVKLVQYPNAEVTPTFLRNLYGIGSTAASNPATQVAVTGFLEQYISLNDLNKFFTRLDTKSIGRVPNIFGPNKAADPGIEANLDIQYVMAMGANVNSTFWYTPGRQPDNDQNEPFLVFLYDVSNATNTPQVFSISYGDDEDTVDPSYAARVSVEFQKAGVRGISILASSGDGGVAGSQPSSCTKFIPTFPAADPYVTAVGGTTGSNPETGVSFSGGGFSNYFSQPDYQTSAVKTYLSTAQKLPAQTKFNKTGAGFPDVSAQGQDFLIYLDGIPQPVSGTSCSSPTFAGIVSLLNDIRLNAGKSTLGWLNPLFYQNPSAFNDITTGNNPGCDTNGFYAAAGWDPITGLGTPNFPALSKLVQSLP